MSVKLTSTCKSQQLLASIVLAASRSRIPKSWVSAQIQQCSCWLFGVFGILKKKPKLSPSCLSCWSNIRLRYAFVYQHHFWQKIQHHTVLRAVSALRSSIFFLQGLRYAGPGQVLSGTMPVVPHKAVAEVSKRGNYRRGELL